MSEALKAYLPDNIDPYAELIAGALVALVILVLGWVLATWTRRLTHRALRKSEVDPALAGFLASIAQYIVIAAAVITALQKVGVAATSLVALLGAAGLAIGLALQGNLSHLSSGVMILLFRPFTLGHRVEIAGKMGTVDDIGLFATVLKTPLNETIIIPNGEITDTVIVNYTSAGLFRAVIDIGVAYGTDYHQAERIILDAVRGVEGVDPEKDVDLVFDGFGASSIDFKARAWCHPDDAPGVRHRSRIAIYEALNEAGIDIPFAQLVVHKAED